MSALTAKAKAVLDNAGPAVEAMKEGRTQDYMLNPIAVVALWDALNETLNDLTFVLDRRSDMKEELALHRGGLL